MLKKALLCCLILSGLFFIPSIETKFVFAETENSQTTQATYTNYKDCIRLYKLPFEKLYFLALSSVNANKYEILEMQSRNGYIIFEANAKEFLLTVMKKDKNFSFLRITPCDNNYYFSPRIPENIFRYVDLNFNTEVKEIKF